MIKDLIGNVLRQPSGQIADKLMRLLTTFILLMICLTAMGQDSPARKWVDTEVKYKDAAGNVVTIHSSFPKGGGAYLNAAGKKYSYVIFLS